MGVYHATWIFHYIKHGGCASHYESGHTFIVLPPSQNVRRREYFIKPSCMKYMGLILYALQCHNGTPMWKILHSRLRRPKPTKETNAAYHTEGIKWRSNLFSYCSRRARRRFLQQKPAIASQQRTMIPEVVSIEPLAVPDEALGDFSHQIPSCQVRRGIRKSECKCRRQGTPLTVHTSNLCGHPFFVASRITHLTISVHRVCLFD